MVFSKVVKIGNRFDSIWSSKSKYSVDFPSTRFQHPSTRPSTRLNPNRLITDFRDFRVLVRVNRFLQHWYLLKGSIQYLEYMAHYRNFAVLDLCKSHASYIFMQLVLQCKRCYFQVVWMSHGIGWVSHPQFKYQNYSKFWALWTQHNYKAELQTAKGITNYCTECRSSYKGESEDDPPHTYTKHPLSILMNFQ